MTAHCRASCIHWPYTVNKVYVRDNRLLIPNGRIPLDQDITHLLGKADNLFLRGKPFVHQFLFELLEEPLLIATMGDFEELPVKLWQLTRSKVASLQERIAFQEVCAFAKHLSRRHIVLHHRWHTKALDWAHLHAHGTAIVAGHDWAATFVDELVLLNTTPPDFLREQGTTRAPVDTDLTNLAELVDTVINRFVVCDRSVCGNHRDTGSGTKMRGKQLTISTQLAKTSGDKHGNVRCTVIIGAMDLGMIAERTNVIGQVQQQRPFNFIRAEVGKLSVHAGEGLRL